MEIQKQQSQNSKFELLENCLKQSGLEIALGREQLFFRTDNVPKLKGRLSDTMNFSMVSQVDTDREKIS